MTSYVAKMCGLYRRAVEETDEVYRWVSRDPVAHKWIGKVSRRDVAVHHIHGRGRQDRYHWFCNLICVSNRVHEWGHDVCPPALEMCCLRAKMSTEQKRIASKRMYPEEFQFRHWFPDVQATNASRASLAGRVVELMDKESVKGTIFHAYAHELLTFLGE